MRRVSSKALLLAGVAVTLLLAGVLSFYASSHPDGLEHVAEQVGFISTAEDHAASGSPLADYGTTGVENERLSGGVAGVVGVLVVSLIGGGLFWALRHRTESEARGTETPEPSTAEPRSDRAPSVGG
jgi:hypothetical protein